MYLRFTGKQMLLIWAETNEVVCALPMFFYPEED
jgi:hypothetical protein